MIAKRETKQHLGRIIARRVLNQVSKPDSKITILLGTPRAHPRYVWECPFRIEGLGNSEVRSAAGADQLQALLDAIASIKYCLDESGVEYVWMNWRDLGSGIPLQIESKGRRFEQRIHLLIEREAKRAWERDPKGRQAALTLSAARLQVTGETLAKMGEHLSAWNPADSASERKSRKAQSVSPRKRSHD